MVETMDRAGGGDAPPPGVTVTEPAVMRRAVGAAAIGNITEWFDFGVYAYLETTIAEQFFPPGNPTLQHIGAFAGFAVSFGVRPLGGLFFGPLGDKIGRTKVLSITVIMMAVGTFLLGAIPSYASIGILAPILLIVCRVIQGFSTGGEYAGAMTFIAEYAPDRRRGFLGSFLECGTFIGYALGATIATVVPLFATPEFTSTWGWRIPFFLALPLGVAGVYLRTKLEETPSFKTLLDESEQREGTEAKVAVKQMFTKYAPAMLTCGALVAAWNITNYMLTSYMPTYLKTDVKEVGGTAISADTSAWSQIALLWGLVILIPFLGLLSEKVGRKTLLWTGSVGLIVLGIPLIFLLKSGNVLAVILGLVIMGLLLVCFSSTCPSTLPALFPTQIRYGGLSISFNIFVSAFAGPTGLYMTALVLGTKDVLPEGLSAFWPGVYLVAAGIVGAFATWKLTETAGKTLYGGKPSVSTIEEARELVAAGKV